MFSSIAIMNYYCCISFFITSCVRKIWTVIISIKYSISISILLYGSSHRRRLCSSITSSLRTINRTLKVCELILIVGIGINAVCIRCTTRCNYSNILTFRNATRSIVRNVIRLSVQSNFASPTGIDISPTVDNIATIQCLSIMDRSYSKCSTRYIHILGMGRRRSSLCIKSYHSRVTCARVLATRWLCSSESYTTLSLCWLKVKEY
jgi:hypothetical protein